MAVSRGQGHETTYAQLVADRFGVPVEQVDVVRSDTACVPRGEGTVGSRSMQMTQAVHNAVPDAPGHLGVEHLDVPLTPEKVWRAIQWSTAERG